MTDLARLTKVKSPQKSYKTLAGNQNMILDQGSKPVSKSINSWLNFVTLTGFELKSSSMSHLRLRINNIWNNMTMINTAAIAICIVDSDKIAVPSSSTSTSLS